MNHLWWYHLSVVAIIFFISKVKGGPVEVYDEEPADLPEDFMKYVQQLGASVFKVTQKSFQTRDNKPAKLFNVTSVTKKNEKVSKSTQNAALRDILMLKLVSYYEDKYKLSRMDETTSRRTTEPLALESLFKSDDNPVSHTRDYYQRQRTAAKRTIARRRQYEEDNRVSQSVRIPMPDNVPRALYGNAAEVVVI